MDAALAARVSKGTSCVQVKAYHLLLGQGGLVVRHAGAHAGHLWVLLLRHAVLGLLLRGVWGHHGLLHVRLRLLRLLLVLLLLLLLLLLLPLHLHLLHDLADAILALLQLPLECGDVAVLQVTRAHPRGTLLVSCACISGSEIGTRRYWSLLHNDECEELVD